MSEVKTFGAGAGARPRLRLDLSSVREAKGNLIYSKPLGSGVFGRVYKAQHPKSGAQLAVKRNLSELHCDGATSLRELDILAQLRGHPYIVPLTDVVTGEPFQNRPMSPLHEKNDDDRRDDLIHFTFPQARSDLIGLMDEKRLASAKVRLILTQVLLALEYMHGHGVVHRDLKPENILITSDGTAQICDFGMSMRQAPQRPPSPGRFTRFYRPPESCGQYTTKADMWSVGCLAYEMATGKVLIAAPSDEKLAVCTEEALMKWRFGLQSQPELAKLVERLLVVDPTARWSATEALGSDYCRPYAALIQQTRAGWPLTKPLAQVGYRPPAATGDIEAAITHIQESDEAAILTPIVLFHALDMFDRSRYTDVPSVTRFLVSLYMAAKYEISNYSCRFSALLVAAGQPSLQINLDDIEYCLLAAWSGRIWTMTIYEAAAIELSPEQLAELFPYYLQRTTTRPRAILPLLGAADIVREFLASTGPGSKSAATSEKTAS